MRGWAERSPQLRSPLTCPPGILSRWERSFFEPLPSNHPRFRGKKTGSKRLTENSPVGRGAVRVCFDTWPGYLRIKSGVHPGYVNAAQNRDVETHVAAGNEATAL